MNDSNTIYIVIFVIGLVLAMTATKYLEETSGFTHAFLKLVAYAFLFIPVYVYMGDVGFPLQFFVFVLLGPAIKTLGEMGTFVSDLF